MQRRHAALVDRVWIGACGDKAGDGRRLCARIERARSRHAVRGIVQGFGTAAVFCADIGTCGDQPLCDLGVGRPERQRAVRCRGIEVVLDLVEVVCVCGLARRALLKARAVAKAGDAASNRKTVAASPTAMARSKSVSAWCAGTAARTVTMGALLQNADVLPLLCAPSFTELRNLLRVI